jgi:hypothetical protein
MPEDGSIEQRCWKLFSYSKYEVLAAMIMKLQMLLLGCYSV